MKWMRIIFVIMLSLIMTGSIWGQFISNGKYYYYSGKRIELSPLEDRAVVKLIQRADMDGLLSSLSLNSAGYDIKSTDRLDLGINWQAATNTTISATLGSATGGVTSPISRFTVMMTANHM